MGKLEEKTKKRRRKQNIQRAVLATIGTAGLLAWTVLAPNTLQLLRYVPSHKRQFQFRTRNAVDRLVAKGQVIWVEKDGKKFLRLTDAGKRALIFEQTKVALQNNGRKRWDGRWRMVVFDIPQKRYRTRDRLRGIMRDVGFVRLQHSVWIYPYDCEDFITLLKANLKIGKDVLYAIADTIERDRPLRDHFGFSHE